MTYKNIIYKKHDRITRITLNRPDVLNALSFDLLDELESALAEAEQDSEVGVIIIQGAGRAFSAGYDIQPGKPGVHNAGPILSDLTFLKKVGRKVTAPWNTTKPVIAQVHGYCVAGGNDLAGQCDIIIAAENAKIMLPQIRRIGVALPLNMVAYNAGLQWAKMLVFTGDSITGKEAERIGLVAKAVPEDNLETEVTKLAMRIAMVPYELLALNKAAVNRVAEAMGLNNVINAGAELDAISHFTKPVQDFKKLAEDKGLKDALAENEAPFKALPKSF